MKIDGRCHCGYITYEADIRGDSQNQSGKTLSLAIIYALQRYHITFFPSDLLMGYFRILLRLDLAQ